MRVLVCGGRDYSDAKSLFKLLDAIHAKTAVTVLISGMASGADSLAARWAKTRGITLLPFPADWTTHGRSAGPIRNKQMLDEGRPDLVIAFPGGRGTANMMMQAKDANVTVIEAVAADHA